MRKILCCSLVCLLGILFFSCRAASAGDILYESGFGRNEWSEEDWIFVKSPRWEHIGSWVQEENHIKNLTPPGHDPGRVIGSPHAYMSMVLQDAYSTQKALEISCRMEFSYDQGPQIVLAWDLGEDENGYPEYRENFEIVLWSRGINIWHHTYENVNPYWMKTAYGRFPLERQTPYELRVRIEDPRERPGRPGKTGKMIVVSVDGENVFAYHEPALPEEIHVGIIGYASINRFYNFRVERP